MHYSIIYEEICGKILLDRFLMRFVHPITYISDTMSYIIIQGIYSSKIIVQTWSYTAVL